MVISDSTDLAGALAARGWTGTIITLTDFMQHEAATAPAARPTVRNGEEPFLLLFSSGTTSNPKAFLKTRHQYRENFAVSSAHLEPRPGVTGGANLPAILRTGLADVLPHVRLISYYGAAEIGFIGDSRDGDGTRINIYDRIGLNPPCPSLRASLL